MQPRITRHLQNIVESAPIGPPVRFGVGLSVAGPTAAFRRALSPAALLDRAEISAGVSIPPEFSGRDYVVFLLRVGAEIEHTLMVQYLFAAYSLGGQTVPESWAGDVRAWQETILGIAKEEMAHLITVQNLLTALGAPINLNREDYPSRSPLYPFGFWLEPLSLNSLAAYVCAESPAEWIGEEADEIRARAEGDIGAPVNRVGMLYEQLIALVRDPMSLADGDFASTAVGFQASWDEWGRGYREGQRGAVAAPAEDGFVPPELIIAPVSSRATALTALNLVAEQGEGSGTGANEELSHFDRFLTIYRAFKALGDEADLVVRPLARNPVAGTEGGDPFDSETPSAITDPRASAWAHLFNVRYRMLLVNLAHAFELADDPGVAPMVSARGTLIHRTFAEMYNLRALAALLVQLPLIADQPDGPRAGPPFQMPYSLTLPRIESDRWRLHRDLLTASTRLIQELRGIVPSGEGLDYLAALAQHDDIERSRIERIMTGPAH